MSVEERERERRAKVSVNNGQYKRLDQKKDFSSSKTLLGVRSQIPRSFETL